MPPSTTPVRAAGGLDVAAIEARWQRSWQERKVHEAHPEPGRPKFFCTYPYSYMNAFAHVGHAYTVTRVDFMARFQRMLGKNVLFPFAYHLTGTPIVAAANRVRENEPSQVKQLIDQGIPPEDVPKFADPLKWVEFFPQQWRRDVDRLGLAVDWRRQFHTTDLNPHYDSFIRWQFRKLKELGYVRKGRHPVIWCPKDHAVVADHDRTRGEGETPQEFVLVKLRDARDPRRVLVAATLRPETMFGQTNVWVHPDEPYT
ncbi:MAG: class I tRNA ligase family protein, partial [bacterium]